jgi:hypothetical protein
VYSWPGYKADQIKENEIGGNVVHTGATRNAYKILVIMWK